MPTSKREAAKIKQIMDECLDFDKSKEITSRLYEEVGKDTDNDSLKTSLFMLKRLFEGD